MQPYCVSELPPPSPTAVTLNPFLLALHHRLQSSEWRSANNKLLCCSSANPDLPSILCCGIPLNPLRAAAPHSQKTIVMYSFFCMHWMLMESFTRILMTFLWWGEVLEVGTRGVSSVLYNLWDWPYFLCPLLRNTMPFIDLSFQLFINGTHLRPGTFALPSSSVSTLRVSELQEVK